MRWLAAFRTVRIGCMNVLAVFTRWLRVRVGSIYVLAALTCWLHLPIGCIT